MKLNIAFLFVLCAAFTFAAALPLANVTNPEGGYVNITENFESLFKNVSLDFELNSFTSFVSISNASLRSAVRKLIPRFHNVSLNKFIELEAELMDDFARILKRMNRFVMMSAENEKNGFHPRLRKESHILRTRPCNAMSVVLIKAANCMKIYVQHSIATLELVLKEDIPNYGLFSELVQRFDEFDDDNMKCVLELTEKRVFQTAAFNSFEWLVVAWSIFAIGYLSVVLFASIKPAPLITVELAIFKSVAMLTLLGFMWFVAIDEYYGIF